MLKNNETVLDVSRWNQHLLNPKTHDKAAVDWYVIILCLTFIWW